MWVRYQEFKSGWYAHLYIEVIKVRIRTGESISEFYGAGIVRTAGWQRALEVAVAH